LPRLSFNAGVRCPSCGGAGRAHPIDLQAVLHDEIVMCPRAGELVEDLPVWLTEWRAHCWQQFSEPLVEQTPRGGAAAFEHTGAGIATVREHCATNDGLRLHYLYSSPLEAAPLNIRAELEVLAALPGVEQVSVRTATTENLSEVWRRSAIDVEGGDVESCHPQVLCLTAHCIADPSAGHLRKTALLLEDSAGCGHAVGEDDLLELLCSSPSSKDRGPPFSAVVLNACHSEPIAKRLVAAGARYVVACSGAVFDTAARAFLRTFLRALAMEGDCPADAFSVAQRAIRLSPQPGLRAEAERFCLLQAPGTPTEHFRRLCQSQHVRLHDLSALVRGLPSPVEDFMGRAKDIAAVARPFLGGRRIVWLHGKEGLGKTALATEFCRFYALPGDRLFAPQCRFVGQSLDAQRIGGAVLVRLAGLEPTAALTALEKVIRNGADANLAMSASPSGGVDATADRWWLMVIDGIDALLCDDASAALEGLWRLLEEALNASDNLRFLITSRKPFYTAPLSRKVISYEVRPLEREDAALLFARRIHRPLYPRDFDVAAAPAASAGCTGDGLFRDGGALALAMGPRRREFVQQVAGHPLLDTLGGVPGDVLSAAAKVTPQLTSLLAHPRLQDAG